MLIIKEIGKNNAERKERKHYLALLTLLSQYKRRYLYIYIYILN